MNTTRRRYSAEFKFHVALDAAKGQQTTSELASEYEVHPNQISTWKRELLEGGAGFSPARAGVAAKSANRRRFRSTAYHQPAGESEYNLHLANYGFATFQQPLLLLRR